jgi:hypothetical protein
MRTMSHRMTILQRGVALGASIALHAVLLLALSWPQTSAPLNGKVADPDVAVRLIEDPGQIEYKPDVGAQGTSATAVDSDPSSAALLRCRGRAYSGIGVRAWLNGTIAEVAAGGPADKVGLKVGDTILNSDAIEPDQHKPGTRIALRYLREEREMPPVVATIEEICNEDLEQRARGRTLI